MDIPVGGCRSLYAALANQYHDVAALSVHGEPDEAGYPESVAQSSGPAIPVCFTWVVSLSKPPRRDGDSGLLAVYGRART